MKYPFRDPSLKLDERVDDLVSRLTIDEKISMLTTWQKAVPRLGIGEWHIGAEVARGYVSRNPEKPTTVFPEPIGLASTFDPELMEKLGEIAGKEARILHSENPKTNLMLWGPTVDACRDPRWGRNEEGYGEDPFLTGSMSKAYTLGMAGGDPKYMRTVPTLKHFFANNNEYRRDRCNANITPRCKFEYYYEFFRPSIEEGGARSMMASYNEISGVPAILNPDLRPIIKEQWGLDFIVTDGGDFSQNVTAHKYSSSHAETIALALKAGTDIMTDGYEVVSAAAYEAIEKGLMTEEDIDRSLKNSLRARFKLGEFDPPELNPYSSVDPSEMDCEAHRRTNHMAALEQFVLLKNSGLLPLKKGVKIAVIGDIAANNYMDWYTGWSSYNITVLDGLKKLFGEENVLYDDGNDRVAIKSKLNGKYLSADGEGSLFAKSEKPGKDAVFIKADWGGEVTYKVESTGKFFTTETMKADSDTTYRWFNQEILRPGDSADGRTYVTYFKRSVLGVDGEGKLVQKPIKSPKPETLFEEVIVSSGAKRAKELAEKADVVIAVLGNNPMIIARECYDRENLRLAPHQTEIFKAAAGANKNALLAIVSGYPFAIQDEEKLASAVIWSSHAGPELGSAFAEIVTGKYNPAGRLPQTWYLSEDDLPPITDYDVISNGSTYLWFKGDKLYPFGFGLSYSSFAYSDISLKKLSDGIEVSFKVKNVSKVDGEETAQVYFKALEPSVKRPEKQLCGFERKLIKAGETAEFAIKINRSQLRFYDVSREKFAVEKGKYLFMVGPSSENLPLSKEADISGEVIPPRDLGRAVKAINYDESRGSKMKFSKYGGFWYMSGGEVVFNRSRLAGGRAIQLKYATTGRSGRLKVLFGDETICEEILPATASESEFKYRSVKIRPKTGTKPLTLCLEGITLAEFKAE